MTRLSGRLILFFLIFSLLTACSTQPAQVETVEEEIAEPTQTQPPTQPPLPTETPLPTLEPTPKPAGLLFRDEFDQELGEGWTWQNEVPEKWRFTDDGWLEITAEDGALLGESFQTNLLIREIPQVNQFEINTHLVADTTSDFQQATLFLIEDSDNFLAINRGHCSPCPTKGDGIFTDYEYDGKYGSFKAVMIDVDEVYLRMQFDRVSKYLTAFYAIEPDKWIQLRKIPIDLNYQMVGIGATNIDVQNNKDDDLVARFDFFEIWDLQEKTE